ncbi:glycosyltransferase family protein [Paraglaciecola polaris]|uniref:Glycosyl transferase family 1 domain-containing protein n=1 Tax=Paraglaciecola polaris LMG 21857 TaxID=1129793 RepID=K6ZTV0_9ALTE|nr:hypothetical protein [Paraglaciecola polaris]GAC32253.1 hypothetical protein GPLA_1339 [Paraglaciecola polaris LMG 21857]
MNLYIYPTRSKNKFLELNKDALRSLDFPVKKIDHSFVFDLLRFKKDSIVVLNWVEDRVYGRSYKTVCQYFFKMVALIIFAKLFAKKVIWVRHNFQPHNGSKTNYRYKFLCGLYKVMGIKATSLEAYCSKPSLLHPLYKKDATLIADINKPLLIDEKRDYLVAFFGTVKPYKNLHDVLDTWPKDIPLKIAGRCSDADYNSLLQEKVGRRGLQVQWLNKFLHNDELDDLLKKTQFVLLPHADSTVISSGAFYHAIGQGCNIIASDTKFGRAKASQHQFVTIFDPAVTSRKYLNAIYVDRTQVMREALACYGEKQVSAAWANVLTSNHS